MSINILYGALIQHETIPDSTWYKIHDTPKLNDKADEIRGILLQSVDKAHQAQYICTICYNVGLSAFGSDIQALDPANTYSNPTKVVYDIIELGGDVYPPVDYTLTTYMASSKDMFNALKPLLDPDIKDRTYAGDWFDIAGAACLQLLREIHK